MQREGSRRCGRNAAGSDGHDLCFAADSMTALAALVLGSALTVAAGAVDPPPPDPPPDPRALKRAARAERRRRTMAAVHTIVGVGLELGSALFYAATVDGLIGRDVDLPSDGCDAASKPCAGGTPVVLAFPVGAIAMGAVGATQLAAAREAVIWRSPMFWTGVFVQFGTFVVVGGLGPAETRNQQLFRDTTFIAGSVIGTVLQVWGAATAPPRDVAPAAHALHVAPACGPTAGGMMCGLALAAF
jgi:hypothetical protein